MNSEPCMSCNSKKRQRFPVSWSLCLPVSVSFFLLPSVSPPPFHISCSPHPSVHCIDLVFRHVRELKGRERLIPEVNQLNKAPRLFFAQAQEGWFPINFGWDLIPQITLSALRKWLIAFGLATKSGDECEYEWHTMTGETGSCYGVFIFSKKFWIKQEYHNSQANVSDSFPSHTLCSFSPLSKCVFTLTYSILIMRCTYIECIC